MFLGTESGNAAGAGPVGSGRERRTAVSVESYNISAEPSQKGSLAMAFAFGVVDEVLSKPPGSRTCAALLERWSRPADRANWLG